MKETRNCVLLVIASVVCGVTLLAQEIQTPEPVLKPVTGLKWTCHGSSRIEGDLLIVDVPKEKARNGGYATAEIDLRPYAGSGVKMRVKAKGDGIAEPEISYMGFKFQFQWKDAVTGVMSWPAAAPRTGSFGEQDVEFSVDFRNAHPTKGTFMLGLQATSGKVTFDLSTLAAGKQCGLFRLVNQNRKVAYPAEVLRKGLPNLRGVMLPGCPCKEDDFKTLHDWGATMARYQMTRNFSAIGADRDLAEYDRWLDGKLDHLEREVLPWAAKYGLKIVVDLHCPPGGRDADRDWSMYHDAKYADHFIACWKRIATRFKGRPEIYGFDLINEPTQIRRALPGCDYWSLQRRAAEVVRAIDPKTPIIIESAEWDSANSFAYLSPLDMDNVIYQVHMYQPGEFTHQGVHAKGDYPHHAYPNPKKGWNKTWLKGRLEPVRKFAAKHNAKIYVGEFSAITWADGADRYIADCIDIFNEYGWDWTYHAFREAKVWDVEYEGKDRKSFKPSADNPRRRALLKGFVDFSHLMPRGGICAHRGDRAEYPENTVPAFKAAVEKGAAMVEFDVHRCKTGELIVMHDDTIDRTTTGKGKWRDLTFAELRAVDAGIKRGERFLGTKVPTFDEAIDCFPKYGVWLNVHCDDSVTDEVAKKIKAKGRLHQAFIAANLAGVKRARAVVPEIKVCLFSLPPNSWSHSWAAEERSASIAEVMSVKAEFTQPHYADFTQEELYDYHAMGGRVNYFWCNQPSRLPALLARGIDFPITDNLAAMVKAYNDCLKRPWAPAEPEHPFRYLEDANLRTGCLRPIDWAHDRRSRKFGGIVSVAVSPKNGRLWRTWYAGPTDGEDSNNYVVLATSADRGKTWKEVLVFDPDGVGPKRAFDPQVWVDPNGKLQWIWCERTVPKRDGDNERWGSPHFALTERLMAVTLDAENEPLSPYPTPRQLAPCGVMMEKPLVTKSGRWLYPLSVWSDDFSARVYESTDGGETLVPVGAATVPLKNRQFEEHSLVEFKDGTLRMYMRVKGNAGWNAFEADSKDGGRSWSVPKACSFPHTNSRLFVRRLKSGALLLVKNGPIDKVTGTKDYEGRVDMTAYVSDDDGATWQGGLLLHAGKCAYPDGDQASDGTIYVVFDDDRFGEQKLFLRTFTEEQVRKGGKL